MSTPVLATIPYTTDLHQLCGRIRAAQPGITTCLELEAFLESKTAHDAQRLANALRHAEDRQDLAADLETHIWKAGRAASAESHERATE